MLRVQLLNGIERPKSLPASRVVIYDSLGNPLLAAVAEGDRVTRYASLDSPDFQTLLQSMGIYKSTVITEPREKPISDIIWTP